MAFIRLKLVTLHYFQSIFFIQHYYKCVFIRKLNVFENYYISNIKIGRLLTFVLSYAEYLRIYYTASLIRKTPDIGRYSITAFFCVSNFCLSKAFIFCGFESKNTGAKACVLAKRGNPEIKRCPTAEITNTAGTKNSRISGQNFLMPSISA